MDELRLIVQRALDGGEVKAAVFAQVDLPIADAVLLERARAFAKTDDLLKRIVGLAGDSEHLVARQQVGGQRDGQRVCAAGDLRADERGLGVEGTRVDALQIVAPLVIVAVAGRGGEVCRVHAVFLHRADDFRLIELGDLFDSGKAGFELV